MYRVVQIDVRDKDCPVRDCFRERNYHIPTNNKDKKTDYQCSFRNENGCPVPPLNQQS